MVGKRKREVYCEGMGRIQDVNPRHKNFTSEQVRTENGKNGYGYFGRKGTDGVGKGAESKAKVATGRGKVNGESEQHNQA